MGDPEKEVGEVLGRDVTVDGIKQEKKKVEDKLATVEKEMRLTVALDGENADKWVRRVEAEVRPKYRAAFILAEEGIKKLLGSASSTVSAEPHTASPSTRSGTKREPVSLPKFVGSEKGDHSPFLQFPVWLENWQQHIVDYETKSCSNLL